MRSVTADQRGPQASNKDPEWHRLLDRQREREAMSLAEGAEQFRAQVAKAAERGELVRTRVGQWMLRETLEPLEQAIAKWLAAPKKKGRPRGSDKVAKNWIEQIGPVVAAYMTLKVVLDSIMQQTSATRLYLDVSENICHELRYRQLKTSAPALFNATLARKAPPKQKERALENALQRSGIKTVTITDSDALQLGAKLVELLDASTAGSLFKLVRDPATRQYKLEATAKTNEQLTQRTDDLAILQPRNQPMVTPPLQWAPGKRGGFRYALNNWYPLVIHTPETKETKEWDAHLEQVEQSPLSSASSVPMPCVYKALNAIQNTKWQINKPVYQLVREIQRRNVTLAGILTTTLTDKKSVAECVKVQRTLDAACSVLNEGPICWFPHRLDFRGRAYPIASYLSPQGDDLSKALLTFSQGKTVDQHGVRWLAIHGANCLGDTPQGQRVSKLTLDERLAWIHGHTKEIVQAADDPFSDTWWQSADDPLQFYAFCVEWRNLTDAKNRGEAYVSSLPVRMDGSCNGLQHFSALFTDAIGGEAVNLVPQERPQDIYQRVADGVLAWLEVLAAEKGDGQRWITQSITVKNEKINGKRQKVTREITVLAPWAMASLWLELHERCKVVDRKLTKQPTMTFGYGSKQYGFTEQLKDYLRGLANWPEIKEHFGKRPNAEGEEVSQVNDACRLMATLIWETLGATVVRAFAGREWLQTCARTIVKASHSPEWMIPATGFGVRQVYPEFKQRQVKTVLQGAVRRPALAVATDKRNTKDHANGISPNVIHSLDAAALMLTVSHAAAEGVESFAVAHDSYATVAADSSVLVRCAGRSFSHLYATHDMLQTLYEQFRAQGGDGIRPPPSKGNLDLNVWLASDYLFA